MVSDVAAFQENDYNHIMGASNDVATVTVSESFQANNIWVKFTPSYFQFMSLGAI